MLAKFKSGLFGSFYLRILGVFLLTLVSLVLVIAGTLKWVVMEDGKHPFRPVAINHVQYIVNDIGLPPDLKRAKAITQEMPIRLGIRGPNINWVSEPGFIPTMDKPEWLDLKEPIIVRDSKFRFAIYPKGEYRYYVAWQHRLIKHKDKYKFFIGLVFLLLVFWMSYWATQRLLRPVRAVSNAAKEIKNGDLNYRVTGSYGGELGELCTNVNDMADSLQELLEAKRQMLLAISHELRSPITRAKLNSEFIDSQKIKQRIVSDLDEMETLVGTLIESERLNQPHVAINREPYDLNVLILKVVALYPNVEITTEIPEYPSTVNVDPLRFELMLRNLVGNAVRYGKGKEIIISLKKAAGQWQLSIQDHGEGIAQEHIKQIAEPFYRPDNSRQRTTGGVGLGLYLSKRIIEAHGGEMDISSVTAEESSNSGTIVRLAWV